MFGAFFESSFDTNRNHSIDLNEINKFFGSGCWLDEYQTGIFYSEQLKAPHSSRRVSLRGTIYVQ
jgi:hypothetical protein